MGFQELSKQEAELILTLRELSEDSRLSVINTVKRKRALLEDIALLNAMEKGKKTDFTTKSSIMKKLKS